MANWIWQKEKNAVDDLRKKLLALPKSAPLLANGQYFVDTDISDSKERTCLNTKTKSYVSKPIVCLSVSVWRKAAKRFGAQEAFALIWSVSMQQSLLERQNEIVRMDQQLLRWIPRSKSLTRRRVKWRFSQKKVDTQIVHLLEKKRMTTVIISRLLQKTPADKNKTQTSMKISLRTTSLER